jgi:hypothetical protein
MLTPKAFHRRNQSDPVFRPDENKDVRARFASHFSPGADPWDSLSLADSSLSLDQSMSMDRQRFSIYSQNTLMDFDEPSTPADFTPLTESGMVENSTIKGKTVLPLLEHLPGALVCLIALTLRHRFSLKTGKIILCLI